MQLDPRARALLIALAETVGVPHEFALGVCWGESRFDPYAVGDAGRAFGLLQMRADVWGWPGSRWQGVDGLERAVAAITPQWRRGVRPLLSEYARFSWDQQVAAFARFWQSAQRANVDAVNRQAERALRAGRAALEEAGGSMVADPGIKWYPAAHPNGYTVGRPPGIEREALVYHTTAGGTTLEQLAEWFGKASTGAATWFGIDGDGNIGQFVSLGNIAKANGLTNGLGHATARLVHDNYRLGARDPNAYTIAAELLDGGIPGSHTPKQLEAAAHWGAFMWQEHIAPFAADTGAVVDRDHVLGHFQFDNKDRLGCPGWTEKRFDWVIARIKEHLSGGVVAPPSIDYRVQWIAELNGIIAAADDDILRAEVRKQDALKKLELWK